MAMDIQAKMVIREENINNAYKVGPSRAEQSDDASAKRAEELRKAREAEKAKSEEARKERLAEQQKAATLDEVVGKVISKSDDGDTVRASEKSMEALNDGIVLQKEPEREITDLTGYSEDQLDVLYREGKISRNDLDKEIEKREELKKQISDDEASEKVAVAASAKEATKKTEDTSTTDDQNKKADRAKEDARKQRVTDERNKALLQENENLTNFENEMSNVIAQKMNQGNDPNLERFGTVEGFNVSITQ